MNKRLWEEIKSERRQLWCEALLIAMQNEDPMISQPGRPAQIADSVLEAYDARFSYDLTPDQKHQKDGDPRRPGHPKFKPSVRAGDI